ncbi:MAG: DUF934 domain-containing protein [Pseudomonadota bacterium]
MRILLADGTFADSDWRVVRDERAPAQPNDALPLARYRALAARDGFGVWLAPTDEPADVAEFLPQLPLVAIDFPTFKDGRGYSIAATLRTRLRYAGELRAIGDVLIDQLFYLKRVGFSSFALRADQDPQAARAALFAFTQTYAGAVDEPLPHFRRRLLTGVA